MKTAECVSPMHPDKICDRISDAILDEALDRDPNARVAVETMGGHGHVYITGEMTYLGNPIEDSVIEDHVRRITTDKEIQVHINLVVQSPEIAGGVDTGGAGDQGIMVGYACNDNEMKIPRETYHARKLCQLIFESFPFDGKTQVTLNDDGLIIGIVASFQNAPKKELQAIVEMYIREHKQDTILSLSSAGIDLDIYVNPAGDWNQGGFEADTGLTGRKLAVDNYGPQIPMGGGAFSGKDSTKVDRSAAYMARRIALDVLNNHEDVNADNLVAESVMIKLAYAIGVAEPVMVSGEMTFTNGETGTVGVETGNYDLTPKGIVELLELKKAQFEITAEWGHFGNDFKWDRAILKE